MIEELLKKIEEEIKSSILNLYEKNVDVFFEVPKDSTFGDYSVNVAMRLARELKKSPVIIAKEIVKELSLKDLNLDKMEVKGSGFINFFIDRKYLHEVVFLINKENNNYGNLSIGSNEFINLEFVSANPTGYLHIGHGRGAAYGDSLARVLKKAGYRVSTEHYVNDAGKQIENLTHSIYERYKELFGFEIKLEDGYYHGKEIIEIAKIIKKDKGSYFLENDWLEYFRSFGLEYLLAGLKKDLKDFNVVFDTWFSEKSLYDNNDVDKTLKYLIDKGYTYELDGAVWLKTTMHGDEKDRVLVKSDGNMTYLLPDVAYHHNKLLRGYTHLIDVLGSDHHGYVPRLKAAIAFVGGNPDLLDVEILQMVRAIQDGKEIKMSKRSGKSITLRDLIDEVGSDALRYMYISKSLSTHMDLDLDLAIKNTNDNPVFYVQYAYARICSLFRNLEERNIEFVEVSEFKLLNLNSSSKLVLDLIQYPQYIEEAATKRLPHKICQYVYALASDLHSYYNDEKVISDNVLETNEKLTLLKAVQTVLKNGLELIGVKTKEKM
ncbi:MAG TPA: arginine--tRNA ligase [Acholeplasmataceae bacterium]|nr:arginine--tRNA ligase [Acholeplasmataceae bacterium]